jgi:peptidoglycan/LPS O-acetylase OafA/YrhL
LICWGAAAAAFGGLMALIPSGGLFGLVLETTAPQAIGTTLARLGLTASFVCLLVLPAAFGDQHRGVPRRVLGAVPLAWLGVISYSFYLWHFTIMQLLALPRAPGSFSASGLNLLAHVHVARTLVLFVASFVLTAAVATLSYRFVELPFLRRKER